MNCNSCLLKEDICKPGIFTKKQTMPILESAMLNDFIFKGGIQKNDAELYEILKECDINYVCYYEYAKFIYNRYKNEYFTSLCKEEPAIESIIDLLYWSFGDPESPNNELQELTVKNIETTLNKTLDKTEKDALVKTRLGQELFKKKLFLYDPKCKICGLTIHEFLIASHIKDWSCSNDKERIDVYNGFLMCPQHDSLFDKGYISFDDDGNILISSKISKNDYPLFNINANIKIDIENNHKKYLKWNRENKFIK